MAKGVGCAYRACHDGMFHLLPFMHKQRVECAPATGLKLLEDKLLEPEQCAADAALSAGLAACTAGSIALVCAMPDGDNVAIAAFFAPSGVIKPMVAKVEHPSLRIRLAKVVPGAKMPPVNGAPAE